MKPFKYAKKSESYRGDSQAQRVSELIKKSQSEYRRYLRKSVKKHIPNLIGSYVVINGAIAFWVTTNESNLLDFSAVFKVLLGCWLIVFCGLCLHWVSKKPISNTGRH